MIFWMGKTSYNHRHRSFVESWMNESLDTERQTHTTQHVCLCFGCRSSRWVCSIQIVFDKFSLNWNPLKGFMQSHLLNYTSVIKFKCTTARRRFVVCTTQIEFFYSMSPAQLDDTIDSNNQKNKSVLKVRHFCRAIKEREMRTQAISIVILSPHRQLNTKSRNVITISPQPRYERNILVCCVWRKSMNGKISRLLLN